MKTYPKIPHWNKIPFGPKCISFLKEDGSNMRFEWSRKRNAWYKFGTRNIMIDKNDKNFGDGISIFLDKYGNELIEIFREKYNQIENVVVFCEYFGKNSFAGNISYQIEKMLFFLMFLCIKKA